MEINLKILNAMYSNILKKHLKSGLISFEDIKQKEKFAFGDMTSIFLIGL